MTKNVTRLFCCNYGLVFCLFLSSWAVWHGLVGAGLALVSVFFVPSLLLISVIFAPSLPLVAVIFAPSLPFITVIPAQAGIHRIKQRSRGFPPTRDWRTGGGLLRGMPCFDLNATVDSRLRGNDDAGAVCA